ncbi:MAG TPA: HD domain-containing phosphohydrolase [Blastocatellia bacterium]|nr:HD domain-containing phosphohydrolase [Blastocatellia bacterium]
METAKGQTREETLSGLAGRIDSFEKYSGPHSRVMAYLAVRLARRFGLIQTDVNAIAEAALAHDIGLFAMSPDYHSTRGPLNVEQRVDLWRHPIIGEQQMAKREFGRAAQLLVRWHHEWWNGSGYPDGLAFEDIPIGARILRAVELFSAVSSERPYRGALPPDEALEVLKSSAGVECDPYVMKALLALLEELREPPTETDPAATAFGHAEAEVNAAAAETHAAQSAEAEPTGSAPASALPSIEAIVSRARLKEPSQDDTYWGAWSRSRSNRKSLLGFEASVLRQLVFKSIAVAFSGGSRLDWYLAAWRKHVLSNDPRAWAAALARATIEAGESLSEDHIARLLRDVYVPRASLRNPGLRVWFTETDAWAMDNLRANIDEIEDAAHRARAMALGIQAGDYALSFNEETRGLKQPLTRVFPMLAHQSLPLPTAHLQTHVFNLPAEEFIRNSHADALYLSLPAAHAEHAGSAVRGDWRECWVRATQNAETDELLALTAKPQSKQAYLDAVDRLLGLAAHIKTWAIGCQDVGIASARDISELIKVRRAVRATYSKDVTEAAGGMRSYIMIAE